MPSRIGLMLDLTSRQLERVILLRGLISSLTLVRLRSKKVSSLRKSNSGEAEDQYGEDFVAGMGAEAIQKLLQNIDLVDEQEIIEKQMTQTKSKQIRKKLAKRLKLVQGFLSSKTRPEWMIMSVLP